MPWTVLFDAEFREEYDAMPEEAQNALLATVDVLRELGPQMGRPHADTLNGSLYKNMKELRFNADDGVWRAAFAFDPKQQAIVLICGDKAGENKRAFYKTLIKTADARYSAHLARLKAEDKRKKAEAKKPKS